KGAQGAEAPAFEAWDALSPQQRNEIVLFVLDHETQRDDTTAAKLAVLQELRQRLHSAPSNHDVDLLNAIIEISNVARSTGDHEVRIEACRAAVARCAQQDDRRTQVQGYQGLAHALSEAGRKEETEEAYQAGLALSRELADHRLTAGVLRNFAI